MLATSLAEAAAAVSLIVAYLGALGGLETYRFRVRRKLVRSWLVSQGWMPTAIRYRFPWFRPNWNNYFWVEALDPTGHPWSGVVISTGRIRRKLWFDG